MKSDFWNCLAHIFIFSRFATHRRESPGGGRFIRHSADMNGGPPARYHNPWRALDALDAPLVTAMSRSRLCDPSTVTSSASFALATDFSRSEPRCPDPPPAKCLPRRYSEPAPTPHCPVAAHCTHATDLSIVICPQPRHPHRLSSFSHSLPGHLPPRNPNSSRSVLTSKSHYLVSTAPLTSSSCLARQFLAPFLPIYFKLTADRFPSPLPRPPLTDTTYPLPTPRPLWLPP